ncbi:5-oxoprolinase subunit PxpA [Ascidiimonas aurantiaca]|uniref:5-oxoprolinase subunit PxpA n=1 Tax=Ascidiimonas aurantiaca TaxID=1685432 RepID=UPI0030ED300D
MKRKQIDINCDLGEGLGNEKYLLPLISRCNIACGGHAGDEKTLNEVLLMAKQYGVIVGAHPSYPDRKNFGRKVLDISQQELTQSLVAQLQVFQNAATRHALETGHVKPHGALYNEAAVNPEVAETVIRAVKEVYGNQIAIVAPWGSVLAFIAKIAGLPIWFEAFADRNYREDLSLVPRSEPNALITAPQAVVKHLLHVLETGKVVAVNQTLCDIKADTFCIHGDTPNVIQILNFVHSTLPKYGWNISHQNTR